MSTPSTASNPVLTLSDLGVDFDDFVTQFQTALINDPVWQGNLTTQTSETLIEFISTVATFAQGRLLRSYEDCFAETALSDDAILSIAQMQGLRISRYLPATVPVSLVSPVSVSLPPLTQFTSGSSYFFNPQQITLLANIPQTIYLSEGQIYSYTLNGLGQDRQTFTSLQDGFTISDQDVYVQINGVFIPKSYGTLWNYSGLPAFSDQTLHDGRLLIVFGNSGGLNGFFGSIPGINDVVTITYPITSGIAGNTLSTINKTIAIAGFSQISGTFLDNPSGGSNDKPVIAYKNAASGAFGTYSSAVTKSQYQAIIATFPGIVDAVTQAQREINPSDYRWMNVIRVSALTTSPWTQAQKKEFTDYCQTVTMYAAYFLWQDAIAVPRDVSLDVYCFNSAVPTLVQQNSITAIQNLFAPRPGILMTNFYVSDLVDAIFLGSPGLVSYVIVNSPTGSMIVTAPESPQATYTLLPTGGSLGSLVYAYGISTVLNTGEEGTPTNWVFPQIVTSVNTYGIQLNWPAIYNAQSYKIWGRSASSLGLLAEVPATQLQFIDDGSIVPSGNPPNAIADTPIRYNQLNNLTINVFYSERQQQIGGSNPSRSVTD